MNPLFNKREAKRLEDWQEVLARETAIKQARRAAIEVKQAELRLEMRDGVSSNLMQIQDQTIALIQAWTDLEAEKMVGLLGYAWPSCQQEAVREMHQGLSAWFRGTSEALIDAICKRLGHQAGYLAAQSAAVAAVGDEKTMTKFFDLEPYQNQMQSKNIKAKDLLGEGDWHSVFFKLFCEDDADTKQLMDYFVRNRLKD